MIRRLLMLAAALGLAGAAHAEGINLSWDDCGAAGQANKAFACDANSGANFILVASAIPPAGTTAITGAEISLEFNLASPALPDWWMFKNAGSCRQTALIASADFNSFASQTCADYWMGQAQGGIASYTTPYVQYPCTSRLALVFAVPPALTGPMDENLEYYICRVTLTRAKTVGTGACEGCATNAMLMLHEIKLTQPVGVGNFRIQQLIERNHVTWQGGSFYLCRWVPTRNSTWGAIKAQYR